MTAGEAWTEWGGDGEVLHFAHGNGFPPQTYRRLLEPLTGDFRVVSLAARPLRPKADPFEVHGWGQLADDLIEELTDRDLRGVVGVGHSLGAVITLMAAARRPRLFRAVVALDPVLLTGPTRVLWSWLRRLGLGPQLPIARGARRRRVGWPDRETARREWSRRRTFSSWQPDVLDDYVHSALVDDPARSGLRLVYPRRWEARVFAITPDDPWGEIREVEVPVLALRGAHSDTFTAAAGARLERILPTARVETVPGTGHFLPMEAPDQVAERIREFAREQCTSLKTSRCGCPG